MMSYDFGLMVWFDKEANSYRIFNSKGEEIYGLMEIEIHQSAEELEFVSAKIKVVAHIINEKP